MLQPKIYRGGWRPPWFLLLVLLSLVFVTSGIPEPPSHEMSTTPLSISTSTMLPTESTTMESSTVESTTMASSTKDVGSGSGSASGDLDSGSGTVSSTGACELNPCLNGGTCSEDPPGYLCTCDPEWTGENCQIHLYLTETGSGSGSSSGDVDSGSGSGDVDNGSSGTSGDVDSGSGRGSGDVDRGSGSVSGDVDVGSGSASGDVKTGGGSASGAVDSGSGTASGDVDSGSGTTSGDVDNGIGSTSGDVDSEGGSTSGDVDSEGGSASGDIDSGSGSASGDVDNGIGSTSGDLDSRSGSASGDVDIGSGSASGDVDSGSGSAFGDVDSGSGSASGDVDSGSGSAPGDIDSGSGSASGDVDGGSGSASGDVDSGSGSASGDVDSGSGSASGDVDSGSGSASGDVDSGSGSAFGDVDSGSGSASGDVDSGSGSASGDVDSGSGSASGDVDSGSGSASGDVDSGSGSASGDVDSGSGSASGDVDSGSGSASGDVDSGSGSASGDVDSGSGSASGDVDSGSGSASGDVDSGSGSASGDVDSGSGSGSASGDVDSGSSMINPTDEISTSVSTTLPTESTTFKVEQSTMESTTMASSTEDIGSGSGSASGDLDSGSGTISPTDEMSTTPLSTSVSTMLPTESTTFTVEPSTIESTTMASSTEDVGSGSGSASGDLDSGSGTISPTDEMSTTPSSTSLSTMLPTESTTLTVEPSTIESTTMASSTEDVGSGSGSASGDLDSGSGTISPTDEMSTTPLSTSVSTMLPTESTTLTVEPSTMESTTMASSTEDVGSGSGSASGDLDSGSGTISPTYEMSTTPLSTSFSTMLPTESTTFTVEPSTIESTTMASSTEDIGSGSGSASGDLDSGSGTISPTDEMSTTPLSTSLSTMLPTESTTFTVEPSTIESTTMASSTEDVGSGSGSASGDLDSGSGTTSPTDEMSTTPLSTSFSTMLPTESTTFTVEPSTIESTTMASSTEDIGSGSGSASGDLDSGSGTISPTDEMSTTPLSTSLSTMLPTESTTFTVEPSTMESTTMASSTEDVGTISPTDEMSTTPLSTSVSTILPTESTTFTVEPSTMELTTMASSTEDFGSGSGSASGDLDSGSGTISPTDAMSTTPLSTSVSTMLPTESTTFTVEPSTMESTTMASSTEDVDSGTPSGDIDSGSGTISTTDEMSTTPLSTSLSSTAPRESTTSTVQLSTVDSTTMPPSTVFSTESTTQSDQISTVELTSSISPTDQLSTMVPTSTVDSSTQVPDLEAPRITCPSVSDTIAEPGTDFGYVTWFPDTLTAVDAVDGVVVPVCSTSTSSPVASGDSFQVGQTTITCVATDTAGNEESCSFNVTVIESCFIPFGLSAGDAVLSPVGGFFFRQKDWVSPLFSPRTYFPLCNHLYRYLYFTDNGAIILLDYRPYRLYAHPSPYNSVFDPLDGTVFVAPFWADIEGRKLNSVNSNVFYQVYDTSEADVNQDILDLVNERVRSDPALARGNFVASWVLVITWFNVSAISPSEETDTFQAVLVTDGVNSFVFFNYANMRWNFALLGNAHVISGFTCGGFDQKTYLGVPFENRYRPDTVIGNTGEFGCWNYRLDSNPVGFVNPRQYCFDWYSSQQRVGHLFRASIRLRNICPCLEFFMLFDRRFVFVDSSVILPLTSTERYATFANCYMSRFQQPGQPGVRCCYDRFWGFLINTINALEVSRIEMSPYNPAWRDDVAYQQWYNDDVLPRYYCCEKSDLCHLYRRRRPEVLCYIFFIFRLGWFFGDPHITTMDGVDYTFNGLGEFTLLELEDDSTQVTFELQARTKRVTNAETQELTDATSFSGFAAVHSDSTQVEVKLNSDGTDLITTVDGTVVVVTEIGLDFDNFTIVRESTSPPRILAIWPSDIQLSFEAANGIANVEATLPQIYMGKTKGLLGLWDGDPSNEVLRRDGLQQNATGPDGTFLEQDYFDFGNTWRTTPETSLFYYDENDSWEMYNDLEFVPKFLEDLIDEATPAKLEAARAQCGNNTMCLYDQLASDDESISMATLVQTEDSTEINAIVSNSPPNITTDVDEVNVIVGDNFTLQISAEDADGDSIIYNLVEEIPGAKISEDGLFKWQPVDRSMVKLGFVASDSRSNATLETVVKLCDCQNGGTCLFDQDTLDSNVAVNGFAVVICECPDGYSGDFCEDNYDACADNPCFLGVTCIDEEPPSLNNTCGPCPAGYFGDGKFCEDIDECEVYTPTSEGGMGCDQGCTNILEGFTCSCWDGYELHVDGLRCMDIDECALEQDDCSEYATCDNTIGGYNCTCHTGFNDNNGNGSSCTDTNECNLSNDCNPNADCRNTVGSYACACRDGFEGDGRTCMDIDECRRFEDDCHEQATCNNQPPGDYTCTCNDGWVGNGTHCTNENECDRDPSVCDDNANCTDTVGSFTCECIDGYVGNGRTCSDINECELQLDECAQECINTNGSYMCQCRDGFLLAANSRDCTAESACTNETCTSGDCFVMGGDEQCVCYRGFMPDSEFVCVDIDECSTSDHNCQADDLCTNTTGGYTCSCPDGYQLNSDMRTCSDVDECALPEGDPMAADCDPNAICTNIPSSYSCNCSTGFTGNGTHCEDIDECSEQTPCGTDADCTDTEGSFRCDCPSGYYGDPYGECIDVDECLATPDICHPMATCTNLNGNYTCDCIIGYEGNGTYCQDIDECAESLCIANSVCTDTEGSFYCTCDMGYMESEDSAEQQCIDINECELDIDNCARVVSRCENDNGSFECICNDGYMLNSGMMCVDINECDGNPCIGDNVVCANLPSTYDCNCAQGYYREGDICTAGFSYNASASFVDISGAVVAGHLFDLLGEYVRYIRELKNATEAAFRSSSLSDDFGDAIVTDITQVSDDRAEVKFSLNFKRLVAEDDIIQAFLRQLTGSDQGQLLPYHRLMPETFIIGAPECDTIPCMNNATCLESNVIDNGYSCVCVIGYSGTFCETAPCDGMPCQNEGTCSIDGTTVTGYRCVCPFGYTGQNCEIILYCERDTPCENGGTCANNIFDALGYTCTCPAGYTGHDCEREVCLLECENGGVLDEDACMCTCVDNWSGETCTECSLSCQNGGTRNEMTCDCDCVQGWGALECTECVLDCQNNGTLDGDSCRCDCTAIWDGLECTDCLRDCQNGGTRDAESCQCNCAGNWTGDECGVCGLNCQNGGTLNEQTCGCLCSESWSELECTVCQLTNDTCQPGTADDVNCECVCPIETSGETCQEPNPCLDSSLCNLADGQYCVANIYNDDGYECVCDALDGYFTEPDGTCTRNAFRIFRLRVLGINGVAIFFNHVYFNPGSTASRRALDISAKVVLYLLRGNVATAAVLEVRGVLIVSGGSVIMEFVGLFPNENSAPSVPTIQSALQTDSVLNDTADYLNVDTAYATTIQSSTSCPSDYCENGGTCEPDLALYPIFTFSCRCPNTFTGQQCETPITLSTPPMVCQLTNETCQSGTADDKNCECVCPIETSGETCQVANPCLDSGICSLADGQYCVANINNDAGYECVCDALDGYLTEPDGTCTRYAFRIFRLRVLGINGVAIFFNHVYFNPGSTASRRVLAISAKVVLYLLRGNAATAAVLEVRGVLIVSGGSVIMEFVGLFPNENSAPSVPTIQSALQTDSVLNDTADYLNVDTAYATTNQSSTSCPSDYCENGGTCEPDLALYPIFTFSCRCPNSFTGQQCETSIGTDATTTATPGPGGLSTLAIVLIVVGLVVLVLAVLGLTMCMWIMMRTRYEAGRRHRPKPYREPWYYWHRPATFADPAYARRNYGMDYDDYDDYGDYSRGSRDTHSSNDWAEEEIRMRHLQEVMSRASYLTPNVPGHIDGFVRPYLAAGDELVRYADRGLDDDVTSRTRVVRNPLASRH